ncbi:hypothetical protein FRC03_003972 [Tulasnella sp. 419]|nr:hypothetical protein FRC03_003972 [Tulasnella sp. 419]
MSSQTELPYTAERDQAFALLRQEAESTDGWEEFGNEHGVKMEKKYFPGDDGSALPLVRGRGIVNGLTPRQFLALVVNPGSRKFWDERLEEGRTMERYTLTELKFHSIQKGVKFLVSPREIVGRQGRVTKDDGTIELAQTSIDDGSSAPSGRVRATLTLGGWVIRPHEDGVDVTYMVKANPNGSIPSAAANRLVTEIPGCIFKASEVYSKRGFPPYVSDGIRSSIVTEELDYPAKKFTLTITAKGGDVFDMFYDAGIMYPKDSAVVQVSDGGATVTKDGSGKVKIEIGQELDGKQIQITVKP